MPVRSEAPDPICASEWLRRRSLRQSDRPALSFEDQTLSYGDLQRGVENLSAVLSLGGLGRGDRVAFLGANNTDTLEVQFACGRLGAIFVPLNSRLSASELAAIIGDAGVHTLVADPTAAALIDGVRGELDCLRFLIVEAARSGWTALEPRLRESQPVPAAVFSDPDDVLMLLYTSGTTGQPKGVMISHRNIWAANLNSVLVTGLDARDVILACAPLFHAAGMCVLVLPGLMAGAHVVLQRGFDAGALLGALDAHRATLTLLVPAMMRFVSQHEGFAGADLSALRQIIAGGAPVPAPLLEIFQARGIPVSQCYGMTESSALATALDTTHATAKLGSCGLAVPLTDVRVVDAQGRDVDWSEVRGEVWLRGRSISRGYWQRPRETAAAFIDGWFRSGDVAYRDADGFLYICDRLKDMIISGGENIVPAEVESVLSAHPAIADVAVIGAPDERWGERVVAVAVLKPGMSLSLEALRDFAESRLARYKLPSELHVVEIMPRNTAGKLLKTELRRRFIGAVGVVV